MNAPTISELRQAYEILDRWHETSALRVDWADIYTTKRALANAILQQESRG